MIFKVISRVIKFFGPHKKSLEKVDAIENGTDKNFVNSNRSSAAKKVNDFIERKNQSMKDSQGRSDYSGSAYNGPGNVDHEKRNSNMSQRNF